MVIVIAIIGILASILVPSFRPAVEFIEVLMAEKYLLKAARDCQIGLINGEQSPEYSQPKNEIGLGVFKNYLGSSMWRQCSTLPHSMYITDNWPHGHITLCHIHVAPYNMICLVDC